jgi:sulfate/thiosulfate transport system permease protein
MTQMAGVVGPASNPWGTPGGPPRDGPAIPSAAGTATSPGGQRRRGRAATSLGTASGLGLGVALLWLSLLVLIPLTAVLVQASAGGWSTYWSALTSPQTLAALELTVGQAVLVTAVNVVIGTAIAWVLVRDHFLGKRVLEVVIDIPFALPTIVAGLVLLSLYGPSSPLGLNWANTRIAVFLAFLFVTLPFIVRTVEPVLIELEPEVEEAAASLGASRFTTFRLIILPSLAPAITSGAALSFARAISEYGSLVLLSGNLPYSTEVASVRILSFVEGDKLTEAAAVASILLVVALVVIVALDLLSRRVARYG